MRQHEEDFDQHCPSNAYIVARLDGRGFTKLTKETLSMKRPFDTKFHTYMITTCEYLFSTGFDIELCYTQSDEISLLLKTPVNAFNGKVRKINSLLSAAASSVFSLKVGVPVSFDCRISPLPTPQKVNDYFSWRIEDARRNGLTAYCYWGLRQLGISPNEANQKLKGLSSVEKIAFLRSELNLIIDDEPNWVRFGSLGHWAKFKHTGIDPRTNAKSSTTRRRIKWLDRVPMGPDLSQLIKSKTEHHNT